MSGRIKANKGYYGILLADSAEASTMAMLTLSLLSLPAAIAATALNLAASAITSYIVGPKHTPSDAADPAAPKAKKPFIQRVKSSPKIVGGYFKATFGDPEYVVGAASAGAGTNLFFQALVGIKSILATHSLLFFTGMSLGVATAGIAACAAVGAIGVFCIFAGNAEKWKAVSNFYVRRFRKGQRAAPQGEDFLQRLTGFPRLRKFLSSKAVMKIKDPLMIGLSTESSIFTIAASTTVTAKRIAAMIAAPHTIPSSLPAMAVSVKWMAMPVWNLISVGRLTVRSHLHRRGKKVDKKKQLSPPVATAVPAQPALPSISLTNAFGKTSGAPTQTETPAAGAGPRMDKTINPLKQDEPS